MIDVDAEIAVCASTVLRRFGDYADREDLLAEGFVWYWSHRDRVNGYCEDEQEKRGLYRLRRDVTTAMERYARKEKAHSLGYDTRDEVFYSKAVIETALPCVLTGCMDMPREEGTEGPSTADPAEGGGQQATVMDVARAWRTAKLSADERSMFWLRLVHDLSWDDVALLFGVTRQTAARRYAAAMRSMIVELGGSNPWTGAGESAVA